jgi:hypothetical protein
LKVIVSTAVLLIGQGLVVWWQEWAAVTCYKYEMAVNCVVVIARAVTVQVQPL